MVYKTLHRKLKIEQHEKPDVNADAPEGLAVPYPLVTAVVLVTDEIIII
jgi:hypothetical protein